MPKGHAQPIGKSRLKTAVSVLMLVTNLCLGSCSRQGDSGREESINIGMEATAVNSLICIADNQKYFAANGIKTNIKDNYPSGAEATDRMVEGAVDISTAAELVLVRSAFARKQIRTIGSIDMFTHMKLIGRKDRGIKGIPDLVGKRIGVPIKTAADFKLSRFLDLNGIDKAKITILDVKAPKALEALAGGSVDAVVTWQPYVMAIEDRLKQDVVIWDVQSGQPIYCLLLTTGRWAEKHPDLMKRFMNSLLKAEDYLVQNGEEARAIVQKRLGYDDRYIKAIWPEHQFSLRLDQSLITAMEDQARWMIKSNLTSENQVPNFLDHINEGALKVMKPEAVNIIR